MKVADTVEGLRVQQSLFRNIPLWWFGRDGNWHRVMSIPEWREDVSRYVFSSERPEWTSNSPT